MTWIFSDEISKETDEILWRLAGDSAAVVPLHWRLEVSNTLLMAERKKKISQAEVEQFVTLLGSLAVETDEQTDKRAFANTLALARQHKLTSYDAAYLELALTRGIALASLDNELRSVAKKLGVEVLPETV